MRDRQSDRRALTEAVRRALAEDIGPGDRTSRLVVLAAARGRARIVSRASGVLAGTTTAREVFRQVDHRVRFQAVCRDGDRLRPGALIARVHGPVRPILTAERTALNFLGRLSGIATLTARYVEAVRGTGVRVLDTRKTTPGLRALEKAAVRAGGGFNHRRGLFDLVLVKDNHIIAAGSLDQALARARRGGRRFEVEVRTLGELSRALAARAPWVMLDNMPVQELKQAVKLTRGRARLEASGGITLGTIRRVARTGVDFISVGALTHSAPVLDIALDLEPVD